MQVLCGVDLNTLQPAHVHCHHHLSSGDRLLECGFVKLVHVLFPGDHPLQYTVERSKKLPAHLLNPYRFPRGVTGGDILADPAYRPAGRHLHLDLLIAQLFFTLHCERVVVPG